MGNLAENVIKKVSGAVWDGIHDKFMEMSDALLNVSPHAAGTLTGVYVKFTHDDQLTSPVYAAVWIRSSKKWVIGLALPEDFESPELEPAPPRHTYAGLNKYFTITPEDSLPGELAQWAQMAYDQASSVRE